MTKQRAADSLKFLPRKAILTEKVLLRDEKTVPIGSWSSKAGNLCCNVSGRPAFSNFLYPLLCPLYLGSLEFSGKQL